MLEMRGFRTNW